MRKYLISFMALILATISIFSLSSCRNSKKSDVITTSFAGYDLARAVIGDEDISLSMLINPGSSVHSYEPSASDIRAILNAKVFIYIGGESDEWVEEEILDQINTKKTIVVSMFDALTDAGVKLLGEEDPESAEKEEEHKEDEEYDEHVWTNPNNAKIIVNAIKDAIKNIDSDHASAYDSNASAYNEKLTSLDEEYKNIILNAKTKLMIFADRFPLLYFVKQYGLSYDAAFKGCSSEVNASSKTIASLKNKVEENNLEYIFVIELSTKEIAKTIVDEIKSDIKSAKYSGSSPEIVTFYTMHNVSKDMFEEKKTYIDMSKENVEVLKKALN